MAAETAFGRICADLTRRSGQDLMPDAAGIVTFALDGVEVTAESSDVGEFVYLHVTIRRLGPDRAVVLEQAMRLNMFGLPLATAWLALDADSDELLLCRSLPLRDLKPDDFLVAIEAMAEAARALIEQAQRPTGPSGASLQVEDFPLMIV